MTCLGKAKLEATNVAERNQGYFPMLMARVLSILGNIP